jgi:hypothetical protein
VSVFDLVFDKNKLSRILYENFVRIFIKKEPGFEAGSCGSFIFFILTDYIPTGACASAADQTGSATVVCARFRGARPTSLAGRRRRLSD